MTNDVTLNEELPAEVLDLAAAASHLVQNDPASRQAVADLAAVLTAAGGTLAVVGVGSVGVVGVPLLPALAIAAKEFLATLETGLPQMALPEDERILWEEGGASFDDLGGLAGQVRSSIAFADLVGRSLDGDAAVAERLDVDRSRVSQRVTARSLYAFNYDDGRRFPAWQFVERRTIPGLKEVLGALDDGLHPLVVEHFFVTPSIDLDLAGEPVSPVDWLGSGGAIEPVVELAADL